MKLLLFSLLLVINLFATTVTFEPTEIRSSRNDSVANTNIYVTVICIDGYKFVVTNSGTSTISLVQMYESSYPTPLPVRCSQDKK